MGNLKRGTDASRAERKAKKRKLEDAIPDLPGDNANETVEDVFSDSKADKKIKKRKRQNDVQENGAEAVSADKEDRKKAKKEKSDKQLKDEVEEVGEKVPRGKNKDNKIRPESITGKEADTPEEDVPKKSKKERKAERKAQKAAEKVATASVSAEESTVQANGDDDMTTAEEKKVRKNNRNREKKRKENATSGNIGEGAGKDPRFIVFIGNLPFSATKESVTNHFAAVKPKSVRHITQKDNPTKSKGIAFVEFDGYDHMKTCLKLFHHSNFDDGISPPRKINVELTAGGGGNTTDRREKIKEKNSKLNDQRFRKIQEEEKAKWEKKRGAGGVDESAIHPSRRARVTGT